MGEAPPTGTCPRIAKAKESSAPDVLDSAEHMITVHVGSLARPSVPCARELPLQSSTVDALPSMLCDVLHAGDQSQPVAGLPSP
jgi:hypothetical protein